MDADLKKVMFEAGGICSMNPVDRSFWEVLMVPECEF